MGGGKDGRRRQGRGRGIRTAPRAIIRSRILVVDDHPLVRDWLSRAINKEPDLIICGEASNPAEAIEALESLHPDMMITDLSFNSGTPGIELIKDIRARAPSLPMLVLSMHDEANYAERSIHAGASGYVSKQAAPAVIIEAIRTVLRSEIALSEPMAATVLRKFANGHTTHVGGDVDEFSDRELEVFELLGLGKSTQEIANDLFLSVKTVETYKTRLKEKLSLCTARELVHHAVQWVLSHGS